MFETTEGLEAFIAILNLRIFSNDMKSSIGIFSMLLIASGIGIIFHEKMRGLQNRVEKLEDRLVNNKTEGGRQQQSTADPL